MFDTWVIRKLCPEEETKDKFHQNWSLLLTRSKKEFGSSFLTSLKQGLTRKTHGKSKVCPSLFWFPPSSPILLIASPNLPLALSFFSQEIKITVA